MYRHHPHHHHFPRSSRPLAAEPARDDLRASDAEREETVSLLREHAGHGRLDVSELSERLDSAYTARTHADLAAVLEDLPGIVAPGRREAARAAERRELVGRVRTFVLVNVLLIALWAAAGAGYFWPIWPMLGWGIGVASHGRRALGASSARRSGHRPISRSV